jgi:hypothetical protein
VSARYWSGLIAVAVAIIMGRRPSPLLDSLKWRAGQNKTANTYVIDIAI